MPICLLRPALALFWAPGILTGCLCQVRHTGGVARLQGGPGIHPAAHPMKKSPREGCRRTRHRSELCRRSRRCSLVPSTSQAGGPEKIIPSCLGPWLSVPSLPHLFLPSTHIALDDVVGVIHDVPSQPKVPNLGHMPIGEQHISSSHVPVDTLRGSTAVISFSPSLSELDMGKGEGFPCGLGVPLKESASVVLYPELLSKSATLQGLRRCNVLR